MKRWITLFACLAVFLSFGMGSVVHAMEPIVCLDANTAAETGHTNGDGDEVPADGDKGYPHHHGSCHGHHIGVPAMLDSIASMRVGRVPRMPRGPDEMADAHPDPGLRPPIA